MIWNTNLAIVRWHPPSPASNKPLALRSVSQTHQEEITWWVLVLWALAELTRYPSNDSDTCPAQICRIRGVSARNVDGSLNRWIHAPVIYWPAFGQPPVGKTLTKVPSAHQDRTDWAWSHWRRDQKGDTVRRLDRPSTRREIDRWRRTGRGPHIGHNCGPSNMIWPLGTLPKSLATAVKFCFWVVVCFFFLSFFPYV